ncbi:hypothetical protein SAMN05216218_1283 [Halorientalis regularis]|uniref:Uncharacterized protein n=1 Tax=Halorientalis regularis TaxID=660518 RepID=A0A1G7TRW3_9EURY|nr:hypothetical protein SAMN05216218_1283 [Halorientalis regularis]
MVLNVILRSGSGETIENPVIVSKRIDLVEDDDDRATDFVHRLKHHVHYDVGCVTSRPVVTGEFLVDTGSGLV